MSVWVPHKFYFVHIPKTAGTSVRDMLCHSELEIDCKRVSKHTPYSDVRKETKNEWVFCFVRNPWDRAVSTYFHCRARMNKFPKSFRPNPLYMDFNEWIKKAQVTNILPRHNINWVRQQQVWWIGGVETVYKYENLEKGIIDIKNRLGIDYELKHFNNTNHLHYSHYYTQETIDWIAKKFADDIKQFGYDYEKA